MDSPKLVAAPESISMERLCDLRRYANFMGALFGGPVYLVGSALTRPEPRDWDIRCILSDLDFVLRYCSADVRQFPDAGSHKQMIAAWMQERDTGGFGRAYWRWADEMHRYSNTGRFRCGLRIDFQVHPETYAQTFYSTSHIRLDTRDFDTFEEALCQ